jgi:UDP-N-acetylglucosamine 2-epimerase (non-hydrolysing)
MTTKVSLVVGARPNFIKAAPLLTALNEDPNFVSRLIHTGQHFDANMSNVFFNQLGLPEPHVFLDINRVGPVSQVAQIMQRLEEEFKQHPADLVIVFGDVNSTLAASLTANKLGIRLAHVEAGLRSYDRSMPEEHNRIVTDMLADLLFTPSPDANQNLLKEGIDKRRFHLVGNIMVDSLMKFLPLAATLHAHEDLGLEKRRYALVTLHRPSNVDNPEAFKKILSAVERISEQMPVVFPVHPRTQPQLEANGLQDAIARKRVKLLDPQSYLEFLNLMMNAAVVLTDSGGIQEETTVLGVPCLTVRENTERPITISEGTNQLVGTSEAGILSVRILRAKLVSAS